MGAEAGFEAWRGGGALRTDVMAREFLERARSRLLAAEAAMERGDHPDVVRFSQECVELSLKACLRAVGIEYPKVHDVSDVLLASEDRFPGWMRSMLPRLAEISRDLAAKRSPAMYGLETLGRLPSELFDEGDAEEALEGARLSYEASSRLIEELFR